jgi:hypothetical protein
MSENEPKGNAVTRIADAPGNQTAEQLNEQLAEGTLVERSAWFHVLYNWKSREILTVKSTREDLELPSLRDEWERLYYCQVDLPIPARGDMSTIKAKVSQPRDTDDKFDLVNRSLAYEFGRRLYSHSISGWRIMAGSYGSSSRTARVRPRNRAHCERSWKHCRAGSIKYGCRSNQRTEL